MAARALLPPLVADAVREVLGVALPRTLEVPWHGATHEERAMLLHRAWEQAPWHPPARNGGGPRRASPDDVDPFVRDAFELLAHPHVSVELVVGDVRARRDESAIVVSDGGFALMARYDERGLMLEAVRPTGLAAALVGLLPPHPPGRGHSASVPTEVLRRAGEQAGTEAAALERELAAGGVRGTEAELIAGVLTAPRLRTGQFSATGYEQHGSRGHVVGTDLGFVDTEAGRYLTQNKPGENGHHLTIAPTDNARLTDRIGELVAEAQDHRLRG